MNIENQNENEIKIDEQKDKIMTLEDIENVIREGTKGRNIDFGDIAVACNLSIEMIFNDFDDAINDFNKKPYSIEEVELMSIFYNRYILPLKKKYGID